MAHSSFSKTFFKIFPPPAFIDMPYAGIDISDTAVHCIEFKRNRHKNSLEIIKHDAQPLVPGIVEGGYIKNEAVLSAVIAPMLKKLGIARVKASLPEEKVYLFRTSIPSLDVGEIAQNIESKLEENVPLSAADAIFHFKIIPGTLSASVSVVPAKVVDTYMRVFSNAGVIVFSFVMQARAVAHALVARDSAETIMIVCDENAGKKIGIYVVYHGVVCFTVTISSEINLTQDISKGMREVAGYWLDHGPENAAGQAIQPSQPVDQEKSPIKNGIDRVIVCGPDPVRTAVESAAAELKIPVNAANVWTNAFSVEKYTPPITADESVSYVVAAGLALPEPNYPTGDPRF